MKEWIKLKVNIDMLIKTCRIEHKDCECSLEYTNVKDDLVV